MKSKLAVLIAILVVMVAVVWIVRQAPREAAPTPTVTTIATANAPAAATVSASIVTDTLTVISWNVESGGSDPATISQRIAGFEGVDLWGLVEVEDAGAADEYAQAAAVGEDAPFASVVGTTGGGDRMAALYDAERFELLGSEELQRMNVGGSVRAPLVVRLRDKRSGQSFLFMVNHLYRGDAEGRYRQARLLNQWAAAQSLPVIAVGDYNFDWEIVGGAEKHDRGFDLLTAGENFEWVRPQVLVTTQCSGWPCRYNSVLDFVFVAGEAKGWPAQAEIVVTARDFPDNDRTSDHRPVRGEVVLGGTEAAPTPTPTNSLRLGKLNYDGRVPNVESDEYIEVVNDGPAQNVAGWQLTDDDGKVFVFPDYSMAAGGRCRVYTNEVHRESCGFSFGSGDSVWSNAGDVAISESIPPDNRSRANVGGVDAGKDWQARSHAVKNGHR